MSTPRSKPSVHLSIDRLVLRGIPAQYRDAVVKAFEAELGRQLAAGADPRSLGSSRSLAALRLGAIAHQGPATPARIGTEVANNLVRGLRSR